MDQNGKVPPPMDSSTPAKVIKEQPFEGDSLLDRIKSKIPDTSKFATTVLIPAAIIVTVLLIGVGGTYIIASNVFHASDVPTPSRISQADIPSNNSNPQPNSASASGKIMSNTKPTPSPSPSPTPTPSIPTGWQAYNFGVLKLNFYHPPSWTVNVPSTSGAPYLYVQSFTGTIPNGLVSSESAILIARLEQVGITTVSALTTQLAINAANNVFLNGHNMGQVNVLSSTPTTINGYKALKRTVTYSASPSAQMTETYILDGVSNVVEFLPFVDTAYGMPFYNQLLKTVSFTQ